MEESFSETCEDGEIGTVRITCYVFRTIVDSKTAKESRETIRGEFFKNNMSVPFSVNGQVHGHYTSEFITRSLKFSLLKDHLLIHVDCTDMNLSFRNELFMASRDRLKRGEESERLRGILADILSKGRLKDIYRLRRASISVESAEVQDLVKSFTKNLPLNNELLKLLGKTFKLDQVQNTVHPSPQSSGIRGSAEDDSKKPPFVPKRFPSLLKIEIKSNAEDGYPMVKVPLGGERTIRFSTDVEDRYFDRVEEPGDFRLALLDYSPNDSTGGNRPGLPDKLDRAFHVIKASPDSGIVRVTVSPTENVGVGDAIKIKGILSGAGKDFEQVFWVKITDPEKSPVPGKKTIEDVEDRIGLPKLTLVYKDEHTDGMTWEQIEERSGIGMDHQTVMHPVVEGERLDEIYVNMDSTVLMSYKSRLKDSIALEAASKRYISAVYLHTLFLYMISRSRKYEIYQRREEQEEMEPEPVDLTEYLKDVFQNYYGEFLLNFEMSQLIATLEE